MKKFILKILGVSSLDIERIEEANKKSEELLERAQKLFKQNSESQLTMNDVFCSIHKSLDDDEKSWFYYEFVAGTPMQYAYEKEIRFSTKDLVIKMLNTGKESVMVEEIVRKINELQLKKDS